MSNRPAAEVLAGLPEHLARQASYRAGWVRAFRNAARAAPRRPRLAVAADLIARERAKGRPAPTAATLVCRWARAEDRLGFVGLVDRRKGPRGPRKKLPSPAEVSSLGLADLADVLAAVAARLRAMARETKQPATGGARELASPGPGRCPEVIGVSEGNGGS